MTAPHELTPTQYRAAEIARLRERYSLTRAEAEEEADAKTLRREWFRAQEDNASAYTYGRDGATVPPLAVVKAWTDAERFRLFHDWPPFCRAVLASLEPYRARTGAYPWQVPAADPYGLPALRSAAPQPSAEADDAAPQRVDILHDGAPLFSSVAQLALSL